MNIIIPNGFEQNYTLGFVKGLLANGVNLCVIANDTDHYKLLEIGVQNINLRGSQDNGRTAISKAVNLLKYYVSMIFYLLRHRGSVIHFTGLFRNELVLFEGLLMSLLFRLFSSRYVYTVHNVLPHSKENSGFFRWIYWLIYRIPNTLLVHTLLAKQQLIDQFSVPAKKILIISIGLNEEIPVTNMTREDARKTLDFQLNDKIVLFFGKADEYKGLETLIEAFDILKTPKKKLLIAAWFTRHYYREKIISMIRKKEQSVDIYLHEAFIPNDKIEIYFKCADVLCLPYKHIYQSGLVFLCLNFGLPIVATNVGALNEFIFADTGIITRTNDAPGVAQGLTKFFDSQSRFMNEKIKLIAQDYKWEKICKSIIQIYQ